MGGLEFKIDGWMKESRDIRHEDDPTLKDVANVYGRGRDLLARMRDELEQLRDSIVPATSRISPVSAGHSGDHGDPTANTVFRIEILADQVKEVERELEILVAGIRWGINYEIRSQHGREIYYMRIIERRSYADIASEVGYSEGYCRGLVSQCGKLTTCMG